MRVLLRKGRVGPPGPNFFLMGTSGGGGGGGVGDCGGVGKGGRGT